MYCKAFGTFQLYTKVANWLFFHFVWLVVYTGKINLRKDTLQIQIPYMNKNKFHASWAQK